MDARGKTHICRAPVTSTDSPHDDSESRSLLYYLIVVQGGVPGTMLPLSQGASSLGRSAENSFQLADVTVSRRHAVMAIDQKGDAWLTDLGSSNGTFINGKKIPLQTPCQVQDGTRIQIGSNTLLKFLKLDPCEEGFQREMFERAVRDNLTGLFNRSYFLSQIGPLANLNALGEMGIGVIMLDIDHFKHINDTHGHPVGDQVLREVAVVLRDSTRSEDLVARYGGEEFIVALPVGSQPQAMERAERIRAQLAARQIRVGRMRIRVTASLGVAFQSSERNQDISSLITRADQALYEAKRNGRNRVVAAREVGGTMEIKTESAEAYVMF